MAHLKFFGGFENWARPLVQNRAFYSPNLDSYLEQTSQQISNLELRELFINTFANTLDTTAYSYSREGANLTYIITGDIEAMWLRDSTAQVWHYLPLARTSPEIESLLVGLIRNHARCILLDPYANAFYCDEKLGILASDLTQMLPGVHERKWELNSLIYPIALATHFWRITGNLLPFDAQWRESITLTLQTLRDQQRVNKHGPYFFDRLTSNPNDTLNNAGRGPGYQSTGMIASSFRASDDSCMYPFNIPENLFALATLKECKELLKEFFLDELVAAIDELITDISKGLDKFSKVRHPFFGEIYAYEVDGLGNSICMDDANVPSLLSLPYLGVMGIDDAIYQSTRAFVLSQANPSFNVGILGAGIGSLHTGVGKIWPISLIIQASTSCDDGEILKCLRLLLDSTAGTGLLHESFNADDVNDFTRPWFAWCNSLFAGLIVKLLDEKPNLLSQVHMYRQS